MSNNSQSTQNQPQYMPPVASLVQRLGNASWGTYIVAGVLAILLGIAALVWKPETIAVASILFIVYLLVSGVFQIIAVFDSNIPTSYRVLAFVTAALSIVLGLIMIREPLTSPALLAIWIGISWIFRSITGLSTLASTPKFDGKGWLYTLNILLLIAGVLIFIFPIDSLEPLLILFAILVIVIGIANIVVGFKIHSVSKKIGQAFGTNS